MIRIRKALATVLETKEMSYDIARVNDKFPALKDEAEMIVSKFSAIDVKKSGSIDNSDVMKICKELPEKYTFDQVNYAIKAVSSSKTGKIDFDDFCELVANLRLTVQKESKGSKLVMKSGTGANQATQSTIDVDERDAVANYVNYQLHDDADLKSRLPFEVQSMQVFEEMKDGLVLCKLINKAVPETIDERALNKGKLTAFQRTENQNVAIASAKAIGCQAVAIGPSDIESGNAKMLLGLVWQILKIDLLAKVNIQKTPEIFRLAKKDEDIPELKKLKPEEILLRWLNYQMDRAESTRHCANLGSDLRDGEILTVLFHQLAPTIADLSPMKELDNIKRAELLVKSAAKLGVTKFISANAVVNSNTKMNLAFLASLFEIKHGIPALTEEETAGMNNALFGGKGDRESISYMLWLNSLGCEPMISSIFEDLSDGNALIFAIDKINPTLVQWKRVNKTPNSRFKKIENGNYIVELAKTLKLSVVGIDGTNIVDGNKVLILGLLQQLVRVSILETLKKLGNGKDITDAEIIAWANKTAKVGGATETLTSFKDPFLATSRFFLHIMAGLKKRIVKWDLVLEGFGDEQKKQNAKYALSVARKLGAVLFLTPEDILEVKAKMVKLKLM